MGRAISRLVKLRIALQVSLSADGVRTGSKSAGAFNAFRVQSLCRQTRHHGLFLFANVFCASHRQAPEQHENRAHEIQAMPSYQ